MKQVSLTIDGQKVEAAEGEKVLFAALDAGIFIPNLCAMRNERPAWASCRLCWVQIEGRRRPVTSCTEEVYEGMVVQTRTPEVDRLVRSAFEMIMSVHRLDCKDCPANRNCALQDIAKARKLPLKSKRLPKIEPDFAIDESHPRLAFNPNHCVLCGKCVRICRCDAGNWSLDFVNRGMRTFIGTFDGSPLAEQECLDCTRCADVCPVGALYLKQDKNDD